MTRMPNQWLHPTPRTARVSPDVGTKERRQRCTGYMKARIQVWNATGLIDELVPGLSGLPQWKSTTDSAKTEREASDLIVKHALEANLNAVIVPSFEFRTPAAMQMSAAMGMGESKPTGYALGILTSVPAGKKQQLFFVSGEGYLGDEGLANIIRVRGGSSTYAT